VPDHAAEERDVGPRPDRDVLVSELASAAKARIDMDDPRTPLLGLHHPAEPDRMSLGHVAALDHDAIRVLEILLEVGRAAAPK
jgi:hypothetical protein